ncbi:MAG: PASTA domain-containing protein, partial [Firmicutes bacterium]|nr:PASTA domain-containing protein [Bacillota bacterium]
VVTLNTPFFDSGELKIGGVTVHCWRAGGHGAQNFVTATENSCNPVFAILGAELLGAEKFYEYITKFGFGKPTGVDFPGEAGGLVPVPGQVKFGEVARWANVGFGQGIAVTPLQLLQAAATIANDGVALRPHFVREIRDKDGNLIKSFASQEGRQVLSSDVAKAFAGVMRSVVVNGSGGQAEIEGYRVAGKTGTAQVARTDGRGYGSERISSFVGFAPVDDPKIAGLVVLYHPKGQVYGGVIAAPVFSAVVEDALEHLGVKKRVDRPVSPKTTGTGERLSVVPNVRNYSRSEAEKLLRNAGLRSEVQGSGEIVLDQVPKPSAEVPIGTTVQLITEDWQSQVESRPLVEVPSVIGLSIRDAAEKLTRLGLRLQVTGSGAAVVQVPEAGTLVPEQATVQVKFE